MDKDARQVLAKDRAESYAPAPTGGAWMAGLCVAVVALGGDLAVATVVNAGDEEARTATLGLLRALVAQGMSPAAP